MNRNWLSVCTSLALAACSSEAKAPPRSADVPVAQQAPPPKPAPPAAPAPSTSALQVSEDIQSACALPSPETRFGYNSAQVRHEDRKFLQQLTTCFTRGPLAQRHLRLVGHADPRGSVEYNRELGRQRADSVKLAMLKLGLPQSQVATESRGKLEATGTDEAGWARDRRVVASIGQ